MIDDRLEEQAADRAQLAVTAEEVDTGIRRVAERARMTPSTLLAEAARQGLSEQDYRDEIRRQIIDGKLVELRVRARVHVTDREARAVYAKWLAEAAETSVHLRIIILRILPGAASATIAGRMALGEEIVDRARHGEDFCSLVAQYNPSTSTPCGSRGSLPLASLLPELAEAAKPLRPGELAEPLLYGDPNGVQSVLVIQRGPELEATPYELVKEQMMERAFAEATDRQRKQWLQELRRGVHIETRL
jgi:peptidyl-prolyl cis-trans isomerase SurA